MKTVTSIIAICSMMGIIFGAYFWMDERYALSEELKQVQQRLDYKIVGDRVNSLQERIWSIEDRAKVKPLDRTAEEQLRYMKQQLQDERDRLKVMEKK